MPQDNSQTISRRQLLAITGSTVAAGVTVSGTVGAQARTTRWAVIPAAEDFVGDEKYPGYFLHFGEETSGELSASDLQGCEFSEWSPEQLTYFNGTLIDRKNDDARQVPTTIYVKAADNIEPGTLWVINQRVGCPGEFIGLEIEQIGAAQVPGTVTGTAEPSPTEAQATNGGGAGFGPLAALASITGLLGLYRRKKR